MAMGTMTPRPLRVSRRGSKGLWRVGIVPVVFAFIAISIGLSVGHVAIAALLSVGVALGAVNGLLVEQNTAKMVPGEDPDRRAVIKGSLSRLGIVSFIGFFIAFLARPNGWVLLIGLAGYQILSLLSQLGAAMKEARLG